MTAVAPMWIDLDGAENVRDLGGLPTADGRTVQPGRLIRSDSLQELSDSDVRHLVDDLHVRAVADLRTGIEVTSEGPGPMTREPLVDVEHLSLIPEVGAATDAAADPDDDAPVVLPWQKRDETMTEQERRRGASATYLRYFGDGAESIIAALRLIARSDGATIVHCAAGKDRTGTVVALALDQVGVDRQAIADDYARSAERVPAIFARLAKRRTYAGDIGERLDDVDKHKPQAVTMDRLFAAIDEEYGGPESWLRAHGWSDDDAAILRRKLLD